MAETHQSDGRMSIGEIKLKEIDDGINGQNDEAINENRK